jgi:hypothetical protein
MNQLNASAPLPLGMMSAGIIAFSAILIIPVMGTLLIPHVLMLIIVVYGFCARPLLFVKYMLFVIAISGIYFVLLELSHGVGARVSTESFKILLLLLTAIALFGRVLLIRRTLTVFAYLIAAGFAAYLYFSENTLSYGGRLGLVLDQGDPDKQISANTLGLLANLGIIAAIAGRKKIVLITLPIFFFVIYLSESRGAFLTLFFIAFTFFWFRGQKLLVALIAGSASLALASLDVSEMDVLRLTDETGSGRLLLFPLLIADLNNSPFNWAIGFGPGAINHEIYPGKHLLSAHSGYVEILYTFGLVGVLALIRVLYVLINKFKYLSEDVRLYIVALAGYAISEDMLGAHTLLLFALIYSLIASEVLARNCPFVYQKSR